MSWNYGVEPNREVGEKEAVHCPVIVVTANQTRFPGEKIKVTDDGVITDGIPNAIVDPFLTHPVLSGDKFLAFIKPEFADEVTHNYMVRDFARDHHISKNPEGIDLKNYEDDEEWDEYGEDSFCCASDAIDDIESLREDVDTLRAEVNERNDMIRKLLEEKE